MSKFLLAFCVVVSVMLPVLVDGQVAADRIKSLPGVNLTLNSAMYSGYLPTIGGRKTFYYFVESEVNPALAPLLVWSNGGPGCSSLLGAFTENGPIGIAHGGMFFNNQYSWTTQANVLFMEGPPGVGFSQDHDCRVLPDGNATNCTLWNDTLAAEANYAALQSFIAAYPKFSTHKLYLSGESYAGHYIPQLASQIQYGSSDLLRNMMRGFMVGNPCTGNYDGTNTDLCFFEDDPTLSEFFKGHAFLSFDDARNTNQTDDWGFVLGDGDYDAYDIEDRYCSWIIPDTLRRQLRGRGRETEKKNLEGREMEEQAATKRPTTVPRYGPCNANHLQLWLNREDVQEALHAKVGTKWMMCAPEPQFVYDTPYNNKSVGVLPLYRDFMANTTWNILVYSGDVDSVVNFIQTQKVISSLDRPAKTEFLPWYYRDQYNSSWMQVGGFYTQYDRISWASVKGAGHMVPTVKPAPAWQLLNSFLFTGGPGLPPTLKRDLKPAPFSGATASHSGKTHVGDPDLVPLSEVGPNVGYFFGGIFTGLFVSIIGTCCWARSKKRKNLWGDDH